MYVILKTLINHDIFHFAPTKPALKPRDREIASGRVLIRNKNSFVECKIFGRKS